MDWRLPRGQSSRSMRLHLTHIVLSLRGGFFLQNLVHFFLKAILDDSYSLGLFAVGHFGNRTQYQTLLFPKTKISGLEGSYLQKRGFLKRNLILVENSLDAGIQESSTSISIVVEFE